MPKGFIVDKSIGLNNGFGLYKPDTIIQTKSIILKNLIIQNIILIIYYIMFVI